MPFARLEHGLTAKNCSDDSVWWYISLNRRQRKIRRVIPTSCPYNLSLPRDTKSNFSGIQKHWNGPSRGVKYAGENSSNNVFTVCLHYIIFNSTRLKRRTCAPYVHTSHYRFASRHPLVYGIKTARGGGEYGGGPRTLYHSPRAVLMRKSCPRVIVDFYSQTDKLPGI